MLNYQRAASADYELFFTRIQEEAADYLEHSLCLLQVTLVEFKHLLQLLVWWWLYRPYIFIFTLSMENSSDKPLTFVIICFQDL